MSVNQDQDQHRRNRLLSALRPRDRDRKDYAMEAARLIKSKNPHCVVEVIDLKSGDVTGGS